MDKKRRPSGQDGNDDVVRADCTNCNVVHVDFGARAPDGSPLTANEIAALRMVFRVCPIASAAYNKEWK